MPKQSRQASPYGEEEEPFWRSHDSSYYEEETPRPPRQPSHLYQVSPDWDDSRWFLGEHYWLGQRYYSRRFWQSVKSLFGFFRQDKRFPDSVVADEVCEALAHEPEVDVDDIEVTVKEGHVTLTGRATDHWMKQQAEDATYFLPGVRGVTNNIRVKAA